jgi:hypothetical protein
MTAAYIIWLLAAIALMFFGGACIFAGNTTAAWRAIGAIFLAAAAGVAVLAGKARQGDPRFQRAAVALSMTFGLLQIAFVLLTGYWALLVTGVALLVAAYLCYRTNVDHWVGAGPDGAK